MTHLEQLIKANTEQTIVASLSLATQKLAEEMAREILKDEAFRAGLHAMVRKHFDHTLAALASNGTKAPRKPRRKKARR